MSWEDILKKPTGPGYPLYTKNKEDEARMARMLFGDKDPEEMTDFMNISPRMKDKKLERQILREIEKEGGALGIDNLKQFAPTPSGMKRIKEALHVLEREGKIFRHKNGDIYTHKPKGD